VSKEALIINSVKLEDAGNYTCVATSAGVSSVEHRSEVLIEPSKFRFTRIFEGNISVYYCMIRINQRNTRRDSEINFTIFFKFFLLHFLVFYMR